jgi:hypothetical protein
METHFCLLGPGKSGSTWLHSALSQHSEFCAPRIKETEFFYKEMNRTRENYEKLFIKTREHKAFGDFSNQNYLDTNVVRNVLSLYPETKFIYLYREPYERLLSAYKFDKLTARVNNVDKFLMKWSKDRLDDCRIINRFINEIPDRNLLVINFVDIKETPDVVYESICDFLGLSQEALSTKLNKNKSREPRSLLLSLVGQKCARLLRQLRLYSTLQSLKSSVGIQRFFYKNSSLNLTEIEKQALTNHVRSMNLRLKNMSKFILP